MSLLLSCMTMTSASLAEQRAFEATIKEGDCMEDVWDTEEECGVEGMDDSQDPMLSCALEDDDAPFCCQTTGICKEGTAD
mmetsp:Transcript_29532/g.97772  ORF Transcript_29532/g.97772 Transcript_29532/m.97772 type:complete len:80 (+) Transcript_29532:1309-1548(+)